MCEILTVEDRKTIFSLVGENTIRNTEDRVDREQV